MLIFHEILEVQKHTAKISEMHSDAQGICWINCIQLLIWINIIV